MKKVVVIGIIALFVGVAVAPSINAGITVKKDIQETVEISDSEEDCNCEVVSKSDIYRIERLLNRLEFIVKIISIKFRNNPEIKEKCQELLDTIDSNRPLYIPVFFCINLFFIASQLYTLTYFFEWLAIEVLGEVYPNLAYWVIINVANPIAEMFENVIQIGVEYCDWDWPAP